MTSVSAIGDNLKLKWHRKSTKNCSNDHIDIIDNAYSPQLKVFPEWNFDGSPIILLTFNHGAEDEVLQVYGLACQGLQRLQTIEAHGIDIVEFSDEDGNGNIRAFDGLPLAYRCFSWTPDSHIFRQHSCRSLPQTLAHDDVTAPP